MNNRCTAYGMENVQEARRHMKLETVADYGDEAYGHILHTWDDGKRMLCRCAACGGYVLVQKSEFHSFSDGDDGYYTDYFFLDRPEEADELNRRYDGFRIEREYGGRYLCVTNGRVHWNRGNA